MDEVFPTLFKILMELRAHLQQMIEWLVQANLQGEMPKYKGCIHLLHDFDIAKY